MQSIVQGRLTYGIKQAAEATCISKSRLYEAIRDEGLKTFKLGGRTLIAAEDLEAWLDKYKQAVA